MGGGGKGGSRFLKNESVPALGSAPHPTRSPARLLWVPGRTARVEPISGARACMHTGCGRPVQRILPTGCFHSQLSGELSQ